MNMKQFIITIPNPLSGEGSRGVENRVAPQGETSVTTLMAYAESEASVRKLVRTEFATGHVPDGTEVLYVTDEPRVKGEMLFNISDTFKDEFSKVIIRQLTNAEKAVELLGNDYAFINERGEVMVLLMQLHRFNGKSMYTALEPKNIDSLAEHYDADKYVFEYAERLKNGAV